MPRSKLIFPALILVLALAILARLLIGDREGGLHWPESAAFWTTRLHRLFPGLRMSMGGVVRWAAPRQGLYASSALPRGAAVAHPKR